MTDPLADPVPAGADPGEERAADPKVPLYASFFGLREGPFDLSPNPRFLFLTHRQREALSNLRYALASARGFTVIVGEAGTGKTTLVQTAMASIKDTPSRYVLLNNPILTRQEFYEFLARAFELSPASQSKARFLVELQDSVERRARNGGLTGLIVDEAQSMPHELLEEIRLLGNIETATSKLLNIVLCGQPELAARLNEPSLRQLKQRVALRCELAPLSLGDTASYISGRLRIAGAAPADVFTRDAVVAVYEGSLGIPRTINVICDNALIGGFAAQLKPVPGSVVEDVCRDFDLRRAAGLDDVDPSGESSLPSVLPRRAASVANQPATDRDLSSSVSEAPKRRFTFFS